ncbi:MAG: autotransporter domain-containing protein [Polyangiaceae bacterium]|nr:autotransporter domain-containing protein [Polyangiaceae bacterium]MCB9607357.1 autotransporter domain-containing protein [Polyangiaceae bacterium]
MKRWAISIGTAAAVFVCSSAALAESAPETHDGFFFRIGPTLGPLSITGKADAGGPEVTYSGFSFGSELMFGGTPANGLVIGGGLLYSQVSDPTRELGGAEVTLDGTMFITSANLFGQYYFDPTKGGHLQLMIGYGGIDFVSAQGESGGNDPVGVNLAIGGGYDFWIGSEWSVGPFLRVQYASMKPSDVEVSYSYLFPTLGASFTYH